MSQQISRQQIRRFAESVTDRVTALGLTDDKIKEAGGPSSPTLAYLRKVSRGEKVDISEPNNSTLDKLDKALRWRSPGAYRLLYFGEEPQPIESRSTVEAAPGQDDGLVELLREIGQGLDHLRQSVDEAIHSIGG